ncbi:hypothetical protein HUG17_5637 [Dermatophagoides farinae]|uniref:KIND domain-containing protein n=1 Tax=Dermatophagoides farinae TaxID=6954 RepID=A0A9D4P3W9_DERFA|nr:hypothetical protein HUG17_5637 [Dermatophagoides farinae]
MIKYVASIFLFIGISYASYGGNNNGGYSMNGIDAAIHSKHSVQTFPVSGSRQMGRTPVVDINSEPLPLTLRFNSHSTRINPIQKHFSHAGQIFKHNTIDEPDVLIQNIRKPIIQEVREIITPFRQVTQEVRPVREQIQTLVARGQDGGFGMGGGSSGGATGGGDDGTHWYHNDNNNNNNNDEQQQQLVKCTLDDDQCLNLANILQSFQTAINEEQAWALCYQIVKCFRQYYQPPVNSSKTSHHNHHHHNHHHHDCYLITDPSHVHIHKDGFIHRKTLDPKTFNGTNGRTLAKSSHKLLTSLGIVLFHALDYGLCDDEERTLSKPLELLIERLTTAHELATNSRRLQRQQQQRQRQKQKQQQQESSSSSSSSIRQIRRKFNDKKSPSSSTITRTAVSGGDDVVLQSSSSSSSSSAKKNNDVRNNDQMSSIGSICLDDDDDEENNVVDDEEDEDNDVHQDDDHYNDNDDDDEEEDEEDDDDDDDDDECANADEGIERDCHEYSSSEIHSHGSSPSSTISTSTSFRQQHSLSPGYGKTTTTTTSRYLLNFDHVMQMCVSRLSCRESADNHYKAVCRALLAETLELSTFLDQIAKGTKELRKSSILTIGSNVSNNNNNNNNNNDDDCETTLEKLQFHDWARLWIQVIRELRHGVKLKKVDHDSIHNTEYELTPYEMLLDDIRARRYKLNKVMVNGDLPPRVKKDAHELILDFIRSRPPLVPVSNRVLKPAPPRQVTLYEKLMDSIRQEHRLRPTPKPSIKTYSFSAHVTPSRCSVNENENIMESNDRMTTAETVNDSTNTTKHGSVTRRKKLLKANIQLDLFLDEKNDENDEQIIVEIPNSRSTSTRPMSAYFPSEIAPHDDDDDDDSDSDLTGNDLNQNENDDSITNDLIMDTSNKTFQRLKKLSSQFFSKERRHSISVCDLTVLEKYQQKQQQQQQRQAEDVIEDLDFNEDHRNHVAAIWEKNDFGKSLECLSLTLKEVQHIRSVLTKAEIESLGVTKSLKKDLENGKICFTCLKTRFTFWGPWATICKLCNRAICDRCATKMHIPIEQFDRVPIYMLSPTPSPPNEKHPS